MKKLQNLLRLSLLLAWFIPFSSFSQTLVWSDEFDGTALNENKWSYQIGDGCSEGICGWGNNELQYYKKENVTVSNGKLHITAKRERVQAKAYTSGRIRTINKGDWTYGRFEALINLPAGGGLWPAFWMMPTNDVYGGWPQSGEIDIMEFVGWEPSQVLGYIHYGDPYPNNQNQGNKYVKHSGVFPGNWHEFALEWEPGIIRWFVDGYLFSTKTAADVAPYHWPFDQDFHFILNVAVGGNLGGTVDNNALPATMSVEYVRVYNGFKPYITGKRVVTHQAKGEQYKIGNVSSNTNVVWTVPVGATIVSGQNTPTLTIDWGTTGGEVKAEVPTSSGTQVLKVDVVVEPPYIKDFHFENFDEPANMTFGSSTGTLTVVNNPMSSTLNSSAKSGKYVRNSQERWDVLSYNLSSIPDASAYVTKDRKFYMDVLTSAPVGTDIIIQLENSQSSPTNYPTGRHSRYIGRHTKTGEWERVMFTYLDRPDGSASNTTVSKMIILFATDSYTGDTYYWDNLDSYKIDDGSGGGSDPIAVTGVSVSPTSASIEVNGTVQLAATVSPSNATNKDVTWSSSNTSIATVSTSGLVTGMAEGSATITVRTVDGGYTATSSITVTSGGGGGEDQPMTNTINLTTSTRGPNTSATAQIDVTSGGAAVSGANVSVTWSGSYSGTASGTTDSNGRVVFTTPNVRNATSFTITVNSITKSGFYWDSKNSQTQASASKSMALNDPDEDVSEGLKLFPNPVNDRLTIIQSQNTPIVLEIYSNTGQLVHRERFEGNTFEVNVSNLPKGIYFVKTINNDNVLIGRFMKD